MRKVALVSGGSRGLGAAIVRRLLQDGFHVATFSRSRTETIDVLSSQYPEFFWQSADLGSEVDRKRVVNSVYERFGSLDILINNAAVAAAGIVSMTSAEVVRRVVSLNVEAGILLTQACVKIMLAKGGGRIVNISSITGRRGYGGLSVYSATKAAIEGFTRSLARELGPKRILVNALAPGYLETEMSSELSQADRDRIAARTPLRRLGTVDEVAGAVCFLLSEEAGFITGQTLMVDGGFTC